jgi:hypothetical protein
MQPRTFNSSAPMSRAKATAAEPTTGIDPIDSRYAVAPESILGLAGEIVCWASILAPWDHSKPRQLGVPCRTSDVPEGYGAGACFCKGNLDKNHGVNVSFTSCGRSLTTTCRTLSATRRSDPC